MITYISVCSGIEAASRAWQPLGFEPVFLGENDPFCSEVLAHHYPEVPNLGDITRFKEWPELGDGTPTLLVGGTPCQSFSIAGFRKGLDDPRGNLTLVYLAIANRYRPRWLVWENVPGVLSTDGGRPFGTLLGGLAELGYGFAYRVLDAQYFGLAQRRERVFVVGYLGDWRRAAAVLFESASLSWYPPPGREAGQAPAGTLGGSSQSGGFRTTDLDNTGAFIPEISGPICNLGERGYSLEGDGAYVPEIVPQAMSAKWSKGAGGPAGDEVSNIISFGARDSGADAGDLAPVLRSGNNANSAANGGVMPAIQMGAVVRRLTPRECERLQGFPDDYTLVTYRGKPARDGSRYKALGNSMAVPVMAWIGSRIQMVDQLKEQA